MWQIVCMPVDYNISLKDMAYYLAISLSADVSETEIGYTPLDERTIDRGTPIMFYPAHLSWNITFFTVQPYQKLNRGFQFS